jgi:hypothetical protein
MEFCCRHVCRLGGEFAWVVNFVASCCDVDAIRIIFLGAISDNDLGVRWRLVFWYMGDVFGVHDKNGVSSNSVRFLVSLAHTAEAFSECHHPNFGGGGIIHELLIAGDVFARDRVHHSEAIVVVQVTNGGALSEVQGNKGVECRDRIVGDEEIDCLLADESNVEWTWNWR